MELRLRFLFMPQIEFSCLHCTSQMPHVYEGAPYAALPKEEKSNLCDYYASMVAKL